MELASRLARSMAVARALIRAGRTLDLAGLDDGVGLLCAQTLDLPPAQAVTVLPCLTLLAQELDLLQQSLREQAAQLRQTGT